METYSYPLAANESLTIPGVGDLVACLDSDYEFTLTTDKRSSVGYRRGLQVRFPKSFESVRIVNGSKAQLITLLIGFGDAALPIPSVVEVIDGGVARTLAGVCFQGYVGSNPEVAQYGHVQLWNTAGSGFDLIIKGVRAITFTGNSTISLFYTTAPLLNANGSRVSKYAGRPIDTVGLTYSESSATQIGGEQIYSMDTTLGVMVEMPHPDEPLVIPQGYGLMLRNNVVNQGTRAYIDYYKAVAA